LKTWVRLLSPALPYVAYLPLALLLCGPVVWSSGWPANHEYLAPFERVECFRRAFSGSVWLPTWTPYPFAGFGSPFPLLYHRLFNTVGGGLALLLHDSVLTVRLLVPALLVLGASGMYALCRELRVSKPLSWLAGVFLMAAPYTLLDWLVRGSMAEFTAAMLYPCWLATLLGFLRGSRRWLTVAVLTALLFHAHSVICYFALPSALVVFAIAFVSRTLTWRDLLSEWKSVAFGAVILCACVLPFALAMGRVIPSVNTAYFVNFVKLEHAFKPFRQYFVDDGFPWGEVWRGVSAELNRYLVVALLAFGFSAGCLGGRLRERSSWFLLGLLVVCLFLQLPVSAWVYEHAPGGRFLQFPWRLNAFMTPALIALVMVAAQACATSSQRARRMVYAACASCLLFSLDIPLRALNVQYGRFDASDMHERLSALSDDVAGVEYLAPGVKWAEPKRSKRRAEAAPALPIVPVKQPLISSDCGLTVPSVFAGRELLVADTTLSAECHVTVRQFPTPALELKLSNATLLPGPPEKGLQLVLHPGAVRVALREKGVARLAWEYLRGER
jgi:hypothetical protein